MNRATHKDNIQCAHEPPVKKLLPLEVFQARLTQNQVKWVFSLKHSIIYSLDDFHKLINLNCTYFSHSVQRLGIIN